MPLDQWRREVSLHLGLIEAGADIILRHVEQLPLRPGFETKANADMELAETVLGDALARVRLARAIYRDKELGT
jgi:hypothetical protein